jgi:hypothetical protein
MFFEFNKYPKQGIDLYSNPLFPFIKDYLLLEVVSFLDEYERNFLEINNRTPAPARLNRNQRPIHPIEPQYWYRIENLQKVIEPLLKTLNRWKDLSKYRNNYVGHGSRATWREGNKLSIAVQENYDAPRNIFEFQIMRDIIHLIFGLISQEFKMELIDADFTASTLKPATNPLKDNTCIDLDLSVMINDTIAEINNQGKDYSLNLLDLDYQGLKSLVMSMPVFQHPLSLIKKNVREKHLEILARIKDDIARTERNEKE